MKKPGQTKAGKVQSRLQRMQRRNYQKNATRKTGVHPQAANPAAPTGPGEPGQKSRKSRMIDLRVESMTRRLVASMRDCPGASFETHCDACGLGLSTFYEWMGRGEEQPKSCYGRFRAAMVKAMAQGEKQLHKAAMRTHAIHLLARRFPSHYPSERAIMEISGKDGLPLIPAAENSFSVVIELTPQPDDREFVIEHQGGPSDGKREIWQPNGQEPPPL
jgi:hypothetical protein